MTNNQKKKKGRKEEATREEKEEEEEEATFRGEKKLEATSRQKKKKGGEEKQCMDKANVQVHKGIFVLLLPLHLTKHTPKKFSFPFSLQSFSSTLFHLQTNTL